MADEDKDAIKKLDERLTEFIKQMESMKVAEYMEYLNDRRKIFWSNFMAGLWRGLGMAIGFTILAAVILYILQKLVVLNLPYIGQFISDIVRIVQQNMEGPR
ncbi:DUF5665 domain-containing protein [Mahella australiensis]|uniref:Uncharacterized protein n=1 Tax=Mahella australiensis (strain DSM 15567 / CIP 107919 / 50-1 BON) TaxID=697281 RepID=F4A2P6_MAHA5|nr:DUF5665 domain-containing protein [Mahella australiensis]AEE96226.1 hypothetical protein Mahau_1028 [Mahella australiensis 50-1 BON]